MAGTFHGKGGVSRLFFGKRELGKKGGRKVQRFRGGRGGQTLKKGQRKGSKVTRSGTQLKIRGANGRSGKLESSKQGGSRGVEGGGGGRARTVLFQSTILKHKRTHVYKRSGGTGEEENAPARKTLEPGAAKNAKKKCPSDTKNTGFNIRVKEERGKKENWEKRRGELTGRIRRTQRGLVDCPRNWEDSQGLPRKNKRWTDAREKTKKKKIERRGIEGGEGKGTFRGKTNCHRSELH